MFTPNIIPVCIPEDDEDLVGKEAWVTGWGRLYEGEGSQTMHKKNPLAVNLSPSLHLSCRPVGHHT